MAVKIHLFVSGENDDGTSRRRRPYPCAHVLQAHAFNKDELAVLAVEAYENCPVDTYSDINVRRPQAAALQKIGVDIACVRARCAAALHDTGVMGAERAIYDTAVADRLDFLTCAGAAFHNDTHGEWPTCLFWMLVLDAADCELVIPFLDSQTLLRPGDLIVFDPSLAHGLSRPGDGGRALHASFEGDSRHQAFLSGELLLDASQWAALGCEWRVEAGMPALGDVDLTNCRVDSITGDVEPFAWL